MTNSLYLDMFVCMYVAILCRPRIHHACAVYQHYTCTYIITILHSNDLTCMFIYHMLEHAQQRLPPSLSEAMMYYMYRFEDSKSERAFGQHVTLFISIWTQ